MTSGSGLRTFTPALGALALSAMLTALAGCQSMDTTGLTQVTDKLALTRSNREPERDIAQTPVRLISIWSEAVYSQPGQVPTRGFGGRLYFYNAQDETIPVDGQLIVYAYEETADGAPPKQPSRRFGFTQEQFAQHFSRTEMGPSYSVWIPWDAVTGYRQSLTLLPVFTTSDGRIVMGDQSMNVLPGKTPETADEDAQADNGARPSRETTDVRLTAYDHAPRRGQPSADAWQQAHTYVPTASGQTTLRTTTIRVPMSVTPRFTGSPADAALAPPTASESSDAASRASESHVPSGTTGTPPGPATAADQANHGASPSAAGGYDPRITGAPAAPSPAGASASALASAQVVSSAPLSSPPATRFSRPRHQVLRAQGGRLDPVRAATPPHLSTPLPDPASPPTANWRPATEVSAPETAGHGGSGR